MTRSLIVTIIEDVTGARWPGEQIRSPRSM
jgi:hypothetical protein